MTTPRPLRRVQHERCSLAPRASAAHDYRLVLDGYAVHPPQRQCPETSLLTSICYTCTASGGHVATAASGGHVATARCFAMGAYSLPVPPSGVCGKRTS